MNVFIEIPIPKYHTYDFNPHVVSPCISSGVLYPTLKGDILFLRYPIYCQRRKFTCAIQAESSHVIVAVVQNRGFARYNISNVIRNARTMTNAELFKPYGLTTQQVVFPRYLIICSPLQHSHNSSLNVIASSHRLIPCWRRGSPYK